MANENTKNPKSKTTKKQPDEKVKKPKTVKASKAVSTANNKTLSKMTDTDSLEKKIAAADVTSEIAKSADDSQFPSTVDDDAVKKPEAEKEFALTPPVDDAQFPEAIFKEPEPECEGEMINGVCVPVAAAERTKAIKAEKVKRASKNKSERAKKRNYALIATAALVVIAIAAALLVPYLTQTKADDMASAKVTVATLPMEINASGYPLNLTQSISFSDLKAEKKAAMTAEYYTVYKVNSDVANKRLLDIPNDTVLLTLVEGNFHSITSPDNEKLNIVELTMGDFFDIDALNEALTPGGAADGESVSDEELTELALRVMAGSKFDGFLVRGNAFSTIKNNLNTSNASNTSLFTVSNRSFLTILLELGARDAYKIRSAQDALAAKGESTAIDATVEFSTPWGELEGTVKNGVITSGVGKYVVEVEVTVPISSDSTINIDTFVPQSQVTVRINSGDVSGLCVPVKAIYNEDGRDFIMMRKGRNNLQRVYISVIYSNGRSAIVQAYDDSGSELIVEGAEVFYEKETSLLGF